MQKVPEMSTIDLKLINEFRLVPALYDRNCKRFKDKAFVSNSWNNIAKKLRYNTNILKDRMCQLRNRYNLEKRKLQALREEGITNPKSMWPLYHNLNFLSGHIKQRKSYKLARSIKTSPVFRGFTKEEGRYRISRPYLINRNVSDETKREIDDRHYEDDMVHPEEESISLNTVEQHSGSKTSQTLNNIDTSKQSLQEDNCYDSDSQKEIKRNHHPSHKFEAFGSFVHNSLQDLPQEKALAMINRFTSEIVRALIAYHAESSNS